MKKTAPPNTERRQVRTLLKWSEAEHAHRDCHHPFIPRIDQPEPVVEEEFEAEKMLDKMLSPILPSGEQVDWQEELSELDEI